MLKNNTWKSNKNSEENKQTQNMVKKMCRWKRMPVYKDKWIKFNWRNLVWLRICSHKIWK